MNLFALCHLLQKFEARCEIFVSRFQIFKARLQILSLGLNFFDARFEICYNRRLHSRPGPEILKARGEFQRWPSKYSHRGNNSSEEVSVPARRPIIVSGKFRLILLRKRNDKRITTLMLLTWHM